MTFAVERFDRDAENSRNDFAIKAEFSRFD